MTSDGKTGHGPVDSEIPEHIRNQADKALEGTSGEKRWEKFGLTQEQASQKAMNAIRAELGTLTASHHERWNSVIDAQMIQNGNDPAALWSMYQKLVKADSMPGAGEKHHPHHVHPDATPVVADLKDKDRSATVSV